MGDTGNCFELPYGVMNTRREALKTGFILAASSILPLSKMGAHKIENSKRGTSPLRITKVEPFIVSSRELEIPLNEAVAMSPIG